MASWSYTSLPGKPVRSQVNNTIYHVLSRDENQCVIGWQEKVVSTPARPRQKLNIFQLSVNAPRRGSFHASGTRPSVNTPSYYRRLNFCGRVVSKKVVPLRKSSNRCERPLRVPNSHEAPGNKKTGRVLPYHKQCFLCSWPG